MTIRETRRIVFDADEIFASLQQNSGMASQFGLPLLAQPTAVHFCPLEECLDVKYDTAYTSTVKIGGSRLAVMLMQWCFFNKIPLPKNADKSLQVMEDNVTLIVTLPIKGLAGRPPSG
jgi:hypothetical protein